MSNCRDKNPLQHDGLSRHQRALSALQPEYIKADERSIEDLMAFAKAYANETKLRFFDNSNTPDNGETWAQLMDFEAQIGADVQTALETRSDIPPHFALFVCFLHLFGKLQDNMNGLTKRHLDFYYKEVLQLGNQTPVADRVHAVFTLAKNATDQIVPQATELDAGKDALKLPVLFKTVENLTVNTAMIAHTRSVYRHTDGKIYHANAANTTDGVAEPLEPNDLTWGAFGPKISATANCDAATEIIKWREANIGFALASPVLRMAEGTRTVTVTINLSKAHQQTLRLKIQFSGQKAWIEAGTVNAQIANHQLTFTVVLPATEKEPVANFDPSKLDGNYRTTAPVMRCWLADTADYAQLNGVRLLSSTMSVAVSGIVKTLVIENDLGELNPEKPFMPFGAVPVVGSNFTVACPETEGKALENITITIPKWIGILGAPSQNISFENNGKRGSKGLAEFAAGANFNTPISPIVLTLQADFGHTSYPARLSNALIDSSLRENTTTVGRMETKAESAKKTRAKAQDFSQIDLAAQPSRISRFEVPAAPYTPLAATISLSYAAQSLQNQIFQLDAFGQAETEIKDFLLPKLANHGTFYLGLQHIGPREAVSMLMQLAEGSANPEREIPTVEWSVLCQNQWQKLGLEEVLSDTTNQLLTSGIVKIYLPKQTTADNTRLENGHVWLRAELKNSNDFAPADSVCRFIGVHTNAVEATFADAENHTDHYLTPMPAAAIAKTRNSIASIKKVEQPYPSFGGVAAETDAAFYTRISERLRHRQRAVNIWDYEHLTLQTFPSVYKAKCLNHSRLQKSTSKLDELAPGCVTIVVVPDIRNTHNINLLEPKIDLNTLGQIQVFLQKKAGKHIEIQTTNPRYERVRVSLKVKFRRGYEYTTYAKKLNDDIVRYLAPWAFDTATTDIPFGGTLQKSVVINYIERLGYIDFVSEVRLLRMGISPPDTYDYEEISATDAMAVLVSCSRHDIAELVNC